MEKWIALFIVISVASVLARTISQRGMQRIYTSKASTDEESIRHREC